ncbi:MAG TPA: hypothetical protein VFE58_06255, partial [Tepidisphaeraceae bacterium]|nr:hypothetical protein [Tepidisphaeraceae bacterium]
MEDFGRITYGEELAKIGPLMEEFEVVPDWGFYPSFKYSPGRLKQRMAELKGLLERIDPRGESRLPLATGMREHRGDLLFFADLFEKLATVELTLEEMKPLAMASGKIGAGHKGLVSLEEAESLLNEPGEFPKKAELREVAKRLEALDARGLMRSYWARVYGIYDVVPHPVDPRAEEATKILFNRFNGRLAYAAQPTVLDGELARTGKAFEVVHLGRESVERGWRLSGWTAAAEDGGEMWRASFAEPGMIARDDFVDRGYRWLVVRLTEGPAGGRKKMMVNGREVGEFVRTGPAVTEKKEWWVTRSFAIPEGVLRNGKLEIRLSEPGIAISEVGLSVGRVADTR